MPGCAALFSSLMTRGCALWGRGSSFSGLVAVSVPSGCLTGTGRPLKCRREADTKPGRSDFAGTKSASTLKNMSDLSVMADIGFSLRE